MGIKAVLVRISTGEILKHADYPNVDGSPIIGLDPDLKWYIKNTPFTQPQYDSRLYKLVVTEEITEEEHPNYVGLNQFKITYGTTKRENEEINASIDSEEASIKSEHLTNPDVIETILMMLTALFNSIKKIDLTPQEQIAVNDILGLNVKLLKNKDEKQIKKAQVLAGEEPNLDEGWERK